MLSDAVAPWHTGGKEQRQAELLPRLARRGFDVHVYTMKWWDGPRSVERDGVTYHAIMPLIPLYRHQRRSIRQAVAFALASLRVAFLRYDALEVDAVPIGHLFGIRALTRLRRRPMLVTWHEVWGKDYWREYLGPVGRIAAWVEAGAVDCADEIVTVSEETAWRLNSISDTPVTVVPNGITREELPTPVRDAVEGDPIRLVSAGRLLAHKRVDVAIDTVAELRSRGIAAELTVIGEGPEREALREHAQRAGVADAVTFADFLADHRDLLAMIGSADALLFASQREGFGMVALEAMSMGTPVVTSDHSDNAARMLVRDGVDGAVTEASASHFADAVEKVLPNLAQISANARERSAEYDWENLADRVAALYREAMAA